MPRRADLAAACAAALLIQLLFTPVTVVLLGCFLVTDRLSRWRPLWLACPGAVGIGLVLSAGAARANSSYMAVAARVCAFLAAGDGPLVPRLDRLPELLADSLRLWPSQIPVALVAAAGQAWLAQLAWRAGSRGNDRAEYRPGALVAARRAYLTATLRRGEVATADGACLGLGYGTWRRAAVSWQEAGYGVLCYGDDADATTAIGFDLAIAAIQHRKAIVIVDLTGRVAEARRTGCGGLIASTCASFGAPLLTFGGADRSEPGAPAGPAAGYDPLTGLPPDLMADHVVAMIDWGQVDETRRPFCTDYVRAALAVLAASRDPRRPEPPVLGEIGMLLNSGVLRKRLASIGGPGAGALFGLVDRLETELSVHPAVLEPVQAQLAGLTSRPLARQPPGRTANISLPVTLTGRQVVVFDLDALRHGQAGGMVARLVIADLTHVLSGRAQAGTPADCLIWINGCEVVGPGPLARLVALGSATGTAVVLGTADEGAASALAELAGVVVVRGPTPPWLQDNEGAIGREALGLVHRSVSTSRRPPDRPDELWLHVRQPAERLVAGRTVR